MAEIVDHSVEVVHVRSSWEVHVVVDLLVVVLVLAAVVVLSLKVQHVPLGFLLEVPCYLLSVDLEHLEEKDSMAEA